MSDSSRAKLSYLEEVTWGVTPAAAMTEFPFTSESLKHATRTQVSETIRSDRQVPDVVRTGIDAPGDVNFELMYGAYDALFAGAMMAAWSTTIATSAATIGASNTNSRFDATVIDWTAENISVGQWIKVGGFVANSGENNGFYRVTSISATQLGVTPAPASDEAATPTVTVKGAQAKNGTTLKSFILEKQFADITEFVSFPGERVGAFGINWQTEAIVNGRFGFLGQKGVAAGATVGTGAEVAAPANQFMNSIDHVTNILEGGAVSTLDVTQIGFELANNLRGQPKVGTLGAAGIGVGRANVTGTLRAYLESRTEYDKYLNFTGSSLSFRTADDAGNAYVWDFPQVKFTDGDIVAGGVDQDIVADLSFTAYRHATDGFTMGINRFVA